jgi:hypothetical protein
MNLGVLNRRVYSLPPDSRQCLMGYELRLQHSRLASYEKQAQSLVVSSQRLPPALGGVASERPADPRRDVGAGWRPQARNLGNEPPILVTDAPEAPLVNCSRDFLEVPELQ